MIMMVVMMMMVMVMMMVVMSGDDGQGLYIPPPHYCKSPLRHFRIHAPRDRTRGVLEIASKLVRYIVVSE